MRAKDHRSLHKFVDVLALIHLRGCGSKHLGQIGQMCHFCEVIFNMVSSFFDEINPLREVYPPSKMCNVDSNSLYGVLDGLQKAALLTMNGSFQRISEFEHFKCIKVSALYLKASMGLQLER